MASVFKPFTMNDLRAFHPNEWSDPSDHLDALHSEVTTKITLWDRGQVAAVLIWMEYHPGCYSAAFLISKNFRLRMGKELRDFVHNSMAKAKAVRIHTDSVACEQLDAWHKYMGFTNEGLRRKLMYGRDYHSWALVREEDNGN